MFLYKTAFAIFIQLYKFQHQVLKLPTQYFASSWQGKYWSADLCIVLIVLSNDSSMLILIAETSTNQLQACFIDSGANDQNKHMMDIFKDKIQIQIKNHQNKHMMDILQKHWSQSPIPKMQIYNIVKLILKDTLFWLNCKKKNLSSPSNKMCSRKRNNKKVCFLQIR